MGKLSRKEFLKQVGIIGAALAVPEIIRDFASQAFAEGTAGKSLVVVAQGDDPKAMVKAAVNGLGGMSKFVKKNSVVAVKPNIGWNREPEYAANTNPEVVAGVVEMCFEAGAKKVKVFDRTCDNPKMCYKNSGIEDAARKAGAEVEQIGAKKNVNKKAFRDVLIPNGESMKSWEVYSSALDCDVFINVPIAKHHGSSQLTLGFKNLMGIVGGNRGKWHEDLDSYFADINSVVKVDLSIIDAYRILLRHGPQGGDLEDVKLEKKIIASADRLAADACAATLFGIKSLPYMERAHRLGLGQYEPAKIEIRKINA